MSHDAISCFACDLFDAPPDENLLRRTMNSSLMMDWTTVESVPEIRAQAEFCNHFRYMFGTFPAKQHWQKDLVRSGGVRVDRSGLATLQAVVDAIAPMGMHVASQAWMQSRVQGYAKQYPDFLNSEGLVSVKRTLIAKWAFRFQVPVSKGDPPSTLGPTQTYAWCVANGGFNADDIDDVALWYSRAWTSVENAELLTTDPLTREPRPNVEDREDDGLAQAFRGLVGPAEAMQLMLHRDGSLWQKLAGAHVVCLDWSTSETRPRRATLRAMLRGFDAASQMAVFIMDCSGPKHAGRLHELPDANTHAWRCRPFDRRALGCAPRIATAFLLVSDALQATLPPLCRDTNRAVHCRCVRVKDVVEDRTIAYGAGAEAYDRVLQVLADLRGGGDFGKGVYVVPDVSDAVAPPMSLVHAPETVEYLSKLHASHECPLSSKRHVPTPAGESGAMLALDFALRRIAKSVPTKSSRPPVAMASSDARDVVLATDNRPFPMTALALVATLCVLKRDRWAACVVCSRTARTFFQRHLQPLGVDIVVEDTMATKKFHIDAYNELFTSPELWDTVSDYRKALVVQDDGFPVRTGLEKLTVYSDDDVSYVGAPWIEGAGNMPVRKAVGDDGPMVGNGGMSLRTVDVMKRVCEASDYKTALFMTRMIRVPEDVFFSSTISRCDVEDAGRVANVNEARLFATEQIPCEDAIGFHKMWRYQSAEATSAFFARALEFSDEGTKRSAE
jgi:hypothetical protein